MVDQGRRSGRESQSPTAAIRLPGWADRALQMELCRHIESRFPGRVDRLTIEHLVAGVLARRPAPATLRDRCGGPAPALTADANRAVLAWLRSHGRLHGGSREYDDLFAATVFGGDFDAAAIRRAMRVLVVTRRVDEMLVVTQYLDMAELNGTTPTLNDIAGRLRAAGRPFTRERVNEAVMYFYRLLQRHRLESDPGLSACGPS